MKYAVIIATVMASTGCHAGPRSVRFGALTVRVSDSKTGQALAGVRVVHVVVALSDNERLADETVYVNGAVDMGAEESRSMLAILRENCASGHPTCGGAPDDVDVLVRAVGFNEAERQRALANPLASYKGLVLKENKGPESPRGQGWVTQRDPFVVEWGLLPNHQEDRVAFARLSKRSREKDPVPK